MEQFSLEEYLKNPSRKVVTGGGEKVRILCTDFHGFTADDRIVAAVEVNKGCEVVRSFSKDGIFNCIENYCKDDLFFAPTKQSRWVFLYYNKNRYPTSSMPFCTKAAAEKELKRLNGFALTEITWEE